MNMYACLESHNMNQQGESLNKYFIIHEVHNA